MQAVAEIGERVYNSEEVSEDARMSTHPLQKVLLNIPKDLVERLDEAAKSLPRDRTGLIVRAIELCIDDFERQAEEVRRVLNDLEDEAAPRRKRRIRREGLGD